VLAFDLTPPERRPYAGTTNKNSMLELAVGPYGVGRFIRSAEFRSASIAPASAPARDATRAGGGVDRAPETGPRRGLGRLFVRAPAGALRLADGQLAAQAGWLLPLALAGLALGAARDGVCGRLSRTRLAVILWLGWLLTYAIVYSYAGGFVHFYYLSTMAPPLAALSGIGLVALCEAFLSGGWRAALLPVSLVLTAACQLYIGASALGWTLGGYHPLHFVLIGGTLLSACVLFALLISRPSASRPLAPAGAGARCGRRPGRARRRAPRSRRLGTEQRAGRWPAGDSIGRSRAAHAGRRRRPDTKPDGRAVRHVGPGRVSRGQRRG